MRAGAGCGCPPGRWRGEEERGSSASSRLDVCLWASAPLVPSRQVPCQQLGPCFPLRRVAISPTLMSPAPVRQEGTVPFAGAISAAGSKGSHTGSLGPPLPRVPSSGCSLVAARGLGQGCRLNITFPAPAPDLFSKMADWQTQQCMLRAPAHLPAAPGWEDLGRWGEGAVLARHCQGRGRTCGFIGLWLQFGALGACKPGWETPEAQNLLKCQTRRVTTPCFFCNKKLDSPL